jgi:putative chitinase
MKISKYFDLNEATSTGTGLYNDPEGIELKSNIIQCALRLDEVRDLFALPLIVSSWYRSPKVNAKVGGAKNSAHMSGFAVDFKIKGMQDLEVALRIQKSNIRMDQLILEPNWLHISFAPEMRQQYLTLKVKGGKYLQGIVL